MSANYWESTQYKNWTLKREEIEAANQKDKKYLTEIEIKKLRIFFAHYITILGKTLHLRQRVVATAIVYWKRFYLNNSFVEFEPALMGGTCIYLASKVEECNIKVDTIINNMKSLEKDKDNCPVKFTEYKTSEIIENEFNLMDGLKCHLLLFHPYTYLQGYLNDAGLVDCTDDAWRIINDSYRTDVYLMYPPHIITLACIYLSGFSKDTNNGRQSKISHWFSELNVDLTQVGEVLQEILTLYEIWGNEITFSKDITYILTKKLPPVNNNTITATVATTTLQNGSNSNNAIVIPDK